MKKTKRNKEVQIEKEFDPEVQEYDQMDSVEVKPMAVVNKKKNKTLLWVAVGLVVIVAGVMIYMY